MTRPILCMFSLALAAALAAWSQIPGQYPPGQVPQGRLPGQTGPPGRQPQPDPRGSRSGTPAKNTSLVTTTTGILRRVSANQLVIEPTDHRVVWYLYSSKLIVRKDGKDAELTSFGRGDTISVDSTEDDDGVLSAVSVSWQKAATAEDRAEAAKEWDLPRLAAASARAAASPSSPARDPGRDPGDDRPVIRRKNDPAPAPEPKAESPKPKAEPSKEVEPVDDPTEHRPTTVMRPADPKPDDDDPGKPALRRGAPPKRPEPVSAPETSVPPSAVATQAPSTTASVKPPSSSTQQAPQPAAPPAPAPVQPPPPPQDDSVIAKAREAAASYTASLPNFFVQQFTTRYQSDDPKHDWHALDIVSADVAYEGGHESYKNIKVGNKAVNKSMDDIEGTRSTGEFSTLLEALLEDGAATFRRKGQDTIRNRSAWVYTFDITRELSRWRIESPSQLYYPAITGSIWIDRETSRVLRIEQQARNMPRGFPFDTTETTADYDFIRLGSTGPFLLPVEAEVLSCIRGTSVCSRNKIEFRNYRKFDSATSITFDDKP